MKANDEHVSSLQRGAELSLNLFRFFHSFFYSVYSIILIKNTRSSTIRCSDFSPVLCDLDCALIITNDWIMVTMLVTFITEP